MSFNFSISTVKGPTKMLTVLVSRISVEPDSTVHRDCFDCTSCEAREKISRQETFTSYGCEGNNQLELADLDETLSSSKEDAWPQGSQALPPLGPHLVNGR